MSTRALPTRQKWDEWISLGSDLVRFGFGCYLAFIVHTPTAVGVGLLLFWSVSKGANGRD